MTTSRHIKHPPPSNEAAATEAITSLCQHTIPKLSERATGTLTYRVGVSESGTVYVAITANQGGGYFSPEWVSLSRIRECLAGYLDTDEVFPTKVLRGAYRNRSVNNGGFLAALLRHEHLLIAGDQPHLHRCAPDWDRWEEAQRQHPAEGERLEEAAPAPATSKGRKGRDKAEGSHAAD
jgi:redox-regulated HSP33 family molecular chaperone